MTHSSGCGGNLATGSSSHTTRRLPDPVAMLTARGPALWSALLLAAAACHCASAFTSVPPFKAALVQRAHLAARQHGAEQRRGLAALTMVQTPPRASVSIKELSKQMKTARLDMEQGEVDERVRVLMEGMRGKSLNDDDFAAAGTEMRVIEFDSKNDLPLQYDPDILKTYYKARPGLWYSCLCFLSLSLSRSLSLARSHSLSLALSPLLSSLSLSLST